MGPVIKTRRQLLAMHFTILTLLDRDIPGRLSMQLAVNRHKILETMEGLLDVKCSVQGHALWKGDTEFDEFNKQREEFARAVSAKLHGGQPYVMNNSYVLGIQGEADLALLLQPVREKYKEAIARQEARQKEVDEILDEELTEEDRPKFRKIPAEMIERLPSTGKGTYVDILLPMIEDYPEPKPEQKPEQKQS